jgi:hypothetical protein
MTVQAQIDAYISAQSPSKQAEMRELHRLALTVSPGCKLWFLDGLNSEGKVVSNPNIGYGLQEIKYANGESKEFYKLGVSANMTGISVYVMNTGDKNYLQKTYGDRLGKAKVTGYCIKFRSLKDTSADTLEAIIADCMGRASA